MLLIGVPELISHGRSAGYAIGYFERWSQDSLQGVSDAAELSRSPVIIGFDGEFLSRPERKAPERLTLYGALGRAAAVSASVPCGFIFNECPDDNWVRQAVTAGFNLVMPVPEHGEPELAYTALVRAITDYAHGKQVAVASEIVTP